MSLFPPAKRSKPLTVLDLCAWLKPQASSDPQCGNIQGSGLPLFPPTFLPKPFSVVKVFTVCNGAGEPTLPVL